MRFTYISLIVLNVKVSLGIITESHVAVEYTYNIQSINIIQIVKNVRITNLNFQNIYLEILSHSNLNIFDKKIFRKNTHEFFPHNIKFFLNSFYTFSLIYIVIPYAIMLILHLQVSS